MTSTNDATSITTHPIDGGLVDKLYNGFTFNTTPLSELPLGSWAVLGPSGGGKEGRAKYLSELVNGRKLSSGDIFRRIKGKVDPQNLKSAQDLLRDGYHSDLTHLLKETPLEEVQQFLQERNLPQSEEVLPVLYMEQGLFVPTPLLIERSGFLKEAAQNHPLVLDGFYRTGPQVAGFNNLLNDTASPIVGAMLVHTDLALLQRRTPNRLSCSKCHEQYNALSKPGEALHPSDVYLDEFGLAQGFCSKDRTPLTRRSDDHPEKVSSRLDEYRNNIWGVLEELKIRGTPIAVVHGNIDPYSGKAMRASVDAALNSKNVEEYWRSLK